VHDSGPISSLISNKDTLLIAVPLGLLILVQFFRLDELVANARRPKRAARSFCGKDALGEMILTDPDGRPVQSPHANGSPATRLPSAVRAAPVFEARVDGLRDHPRQASAP
jgi:hypothetical protein